MSPSPVGPPDSFPLHLLHLLNLSFVIEMPNRCCILEVRANKYVVCNFLKCVKQVFVCFNCFVVVVLLLFVFVCFVFVFVFSNYFTELKHQGHSMFLCSNDTMQQKYWNKNCPGLMRQYKFVPKRNE